MSIPSLLHLRWRQTKLRRQTQRGPQSWTARWRRRCEWRGRLLLEGEGPRVMMGFYSFYCFFFHGGFLKRWISQNGTKWMIYRGNSYLVWMILGSCHLWKPHETSIWFLVVFTIVKWNIPDDLTYPWIILSHWSLPEVGWDEIWGKP